MALYFYLRHIKTLMEITPNLIYIKFKVLRLRNFLRVILFSSESLFPSAN